ncbi:hypothetical protein FRX31_023975 [Thalictrum thalictroides]|uniref:Uncharacterized protein n=1 Tax=Thalictrum thalictroides TaxID=46969 RepID=A0A7J6VPF8_THATH|nr:hypothetical protein FRX31_023975 [Thalictrum thalictroides]
MTINMEGWVIAVELVDQKDIERERRRSDNREEMEEDVDDEVAKIKGACFEDLYRDFSSEGSLGVSCDLWEGGLA